MSSSLSSRRLSMGRGAKAGAVRMTRRPSTRRLMMSSMALALASTSAWADVTATSSTAGVQVSNPNAGVTQIVAPDNAIINYSEFNVAGGESVQFVQPSAGSRVLNRIHSASPSVIDGTLSANGTVYLVNPAGVTFGNGAVVNVGALYAAAGNVSDVDFLAGVDRFTGLSGAVHNHGTIYAESLVALIGRDVSHGGSIVAPAGTVVMASGDSVLIGQIRGNVFVSVETSVEANADAGGVEVSGTVQAPAISLVSGDIYSMAVSGWLDASSETGEGGDITVTGRTVEVTGTLDASGATAGGTIHVGGELRGSGDTPAAQRTYVGPEAVLRAAATQAGDGGTVVVWAEEATWYYGTIDASAGPAGGDGGFVEVSGKTFLAFAGEIDASGLGGAAGTILLDPENITIVDGGPASDDGEVADGTVLAGEIPDGQLLISEQALEALSGNIVLEATDTISIEDLSDDVLDLTNADSVTFSADQGGVGGEFFMVAGDTILTDGANITITAEHVRIPGNIDTTGASGTSSGDLTLTAVGDQAINRMFLRGTINLGSGGVFDALSSGNISLIGDITAGEVDVFSGGDDTSSTFGSISFDAETGLNTIRADVQTFEANGVAGGAIDNFPGFVQYLNSAGDGAPDSFTFIQAESISDQFSSFGLPPNTDQFGGSGPGEYNLVSVNGSIELGESYDLGGTDFTLEAPTNGEGGAITILSGGEVLTGGGDFSSIDGDLTHSGLIDTDGGDFSQDGDGLTIGSGGSIFTQGGDFDSAGGDFDSLGSIETGGGDFASQGNDFDNQGVINTRLDPGVADPAGSVTIDHDGTVNLGTILAGSIVIIDPGDIDLGDIETSGGFSFTSGGDITFGTITATGGDVFLQSTGGDINPDGEDPGDITAGGSIELRADNDLNVGTLMTLSAGQSLVFIFGNDFNATQATSPFMFDTIQMSGSAAGGGSLGGNGGLGWGGGDSTLSINENNGQFAGQNLDLTVSGFQDIVVGVTGLEGFETLEDQGGIESGSASVIGIGPDQTLTIRTEAGSNGDTFNDGNVTIADQPFGTTNTAGAFTVIAADGGILANSVTTEGDQTYRVLSNAAINLNSVYATQGGDFVADGDVVLGNADTDPNDTVTSVLSEGGDVTFMGDVSTQNGKALVVNTGGVDVGTVVFENNIGDGGELMQLDALGQTLLFNDISTQGDINIVAGSGGVTINSTVDSNGGDIFITTGQIVFSADPTINKTEAGDLLFFTRGGNLTINPFETVGVAEGSLVFDTATAPVGGAGNISFGGVNVPEGSLLVNALGNTTIFETRMDDTATVNATGGPGLLLVDGGPFTSGFNGAPINQVNGVRIDTDRITLNHNGTTSVLIQSTDGQVRINANSFALNPAGQRGIIAVPNLVDAFVQTPAVVPAFFITDDLVAPREITLDLNDLVASLLYDAGNRVTALKPATRQLVLTEADLETLQKFVPGARQVRPDERIETTEGRAVYNDTLRRADGITSSDYNVVITRMNPDAVVAALATYRSVLLAGEDSRAPEIREQLAQAAIDYANAGHAVEGEAYDPAAFRGFLAGAPGNEQLVADLDKLAVLLNQIDRMGLNEVEEENSFREILIGLTPSDLNLEQTRALIMSSAQPTAPPPPADGPGEGDTETAVRTQEDAPVTVAARP
ncbi:filamentous hemagglutinin N-terminal domain-containing protein [Phycisphaeraceae bacterium D3-23]